MASAADQPILSVLMPVHNEAGTLREIVGRVLASPVGVPVELICVDDGSTDDSPKILDELASSDPRICVIHQRPNRGKGAAIRAAIAAMTGRVAIIQDADLEYDPADYPRLIHPILAGEADAVFGSRVLGDRTGDTQRLFQRLGNRALTRLSNALTGLRLTDMETCYKAVRADLLRTIPLRSDRFTIEPEITLRLAQLGARIVERPISYNGRTVAEGKSIGPADGLEALWTMLRLRFLTRPLSPADAPARSAEEYQIVIKAGMPAPPIHTDPL